jgi:hypothetical protein
MPVNKYDTVVVFGNVRADGTPDIADVIHRLPVPALSMSIRQSIKTDSADIKHRSGKAAQADGFKNATIEIRLALLDDETWNGSSMTYYTALEKLAELQLIFRDRAQPVGDGQAVKTARADVPRAYAVSSPEIDSAGIKSVRITEFSSEFVGNGYSDINVVLSLEEFEPPVYQAEKRGSEPVNESLGDGGYTGEENGGGYSGYDDAIMSEAQSSQDGMTGTESAFAEGYRKAKEQASGGLGGTW